MRTHLSGSSGLDGMPLTYDAFRERYVLGLVCLDKWVLLCAGKWIFGRLRKFPEKTQKIHAPEGARCQKWDQREAKGAPGAPLARPGVGPRPLPPGGLPPPLVPYRGPYLFS